MIGAIGIALIAAVLALEGLCRINATVEVPMLPIVGIATGAGLIAWHFIG